jgi:hypothetical protein
MQKYFPREAQAASIRAVKFRRLLLTPRIAQGRLVECLPP